MSGRIGLLAGSFDPVTFGHLDIIRRASQLFDQLYVGIFFNRDKSGYFDVATRQKLLRASLQDLANVKVILAQDSLAVDIAQELGVTHLVRGLRNANDLAYEMELSFFNQQLAEDLETIFLLTAPQWQHVSSSRVRELIAFGADISPFVPQAVVRKVNECHEKKQTI
ncbi:pantetheine-phosphate adenylyltransferase [Streptococcus cuniculipharyngis]|uniref:Phosphopantetheine adenylyltransferase n=1 Tax=Streptococcus cuniculipharyngis TaxID=1562651 RepID=A0A5C5SDP8_9STRE|nr:pantetheine-phosphate adenylyltransferase [Streptococcus cuniculipharyngis]TWS98073.1 pantetheine-phosphate adenylyltransferase [Streptococcus cuniculipharyngis]